MFPSSYIRQLVGVARESLIRYVSLMTRTRGVRHHGPSIRAWRVERGLAIDELAENVGYTRSGLNNVEREHRPTMPLAKLLHLARALSVDPAVLLREPIGQEGASATVEEVSA